MSSDGGPVTEQGVLTVRPGQEAAFEAAMGVAQPLIAASPGFGGLRLSRCLERPGTYLLLVEWASLADHTEGFRGSPAYQEWRAALHRFYEPMPVIEHFVTVLETSAP
jgi:heme-degrading monooxygenase HmoA